MTNQRAVSRKEIHTRRIECKGYLRDDELWEIEGRIIDTKSYDFQTLERLVYSGEPMHDMSVCLTIDHKFKILEVKSRTNSSPFKDCPSCNPVYQQLVGLNILAPGFQGRVKELVGSAAGCTHITELFRPLATTAYQTIGSWLHDRCEDGSLGAEQLKLVGSLVDSCYGFRASGQVIRVNFPDAYKGSIPLAQG